jgi:hypothetical protein
LKPLLIESSQDAPYTVKPLWSHPLAAPPRGLALAREAGAVLLWDADHRLTLFDRSGTVQAQRDGRAGCTAVGAADDGSCAAAGGEAGQLWLLAPDLSVLWQQSVPYRVTALALSQLGNHLAAADAGGGLHVFDRQGRLVWRAATPRALHFLAFVPERARLVGAADFGLVTCFDASGRALWQEGLVAHAGSLSASRDGGILCLACFTEGLVHFNLEGARPRRTRLGFPCRLAALSYDGGLVLTADLEKGLALSDWAGTVRNHCELDAPPAAIALGPLGDYAVAATASRLLALAAEA